MQVRWFYILAVRLDLACVNAVEPTPRSDPAEAKKKRAQTG